MKANETTEAIRVAKKNSPLEVSSRIISGIFTPFMIPFVAFFLGYLGLLVLFLMLFQILV